MTGFVGAGYVGNFTSLSDLLAKYPAINYAGRRATLDNGTTTLSYFCDGVQWYLEGGSGVQTEVTATGVLPDSAASNITPYNSASAGILTLPSASSAWAKKPYGLVFVPILAAGIPTFAPAGSDTLVATAGVPLGVVNGYIAAQVRSSTKWVTI